jgi:hypothetical protein
MIDQSALGPDGRLLDASEIEWYNDPDDAQPIQPTSSVQGTVFKCTAFGDLITHSFVLSGQRSRPVRVTTGTRLAEALAAEKLDEFGNPTQSSNSSCQRVIQPLKPRASAKRKRTTKDNANTDTEDRTFTASAAEDGSDDDSDGDDIEISNEEV